MQFRCCNSCACSFVPALTIAESGIACAQSLSPLVASICKTRVDGLKPLKRSMEFSDFFFFGTVSPEGTKLENMSIKQCNLFHAVPILMRASQIAGDRSASVPSSVGELTNGRPLRDPSLRRSGLVSGASEIRSNSAAPLRSLGPINQRSGDGVRLVQSSNRSWPTKNPRLVGV
jgi:hypothetical protein